MYTIFVLLFLHDLRRSRPYAKFFTEEIPEMITPAKSLTTTQILSMIRRTANFSKIDQVLRDEPALPEFSHVLYDIMARNDLKARDVIAEVGMERSYFYHILNGTKTPSRNIVLRICFSVRATLEETNRLLLLSAQGSLYAKIRRDAAIIFCIEKKYTMKDANEFLLRIGELPLYKET